MNINWKISKDCEAFEKSVRAHKERIKEWGKLKTLRWIFDIDKVDLDLDCAKEFCAAMHIKTPLDNALYLSSLWSDLSL